MNAQPFSASLSPSYLFGNSIDAYDLDESFELLSDIGSNENLQHLFIHALKYPPGEALRHIKDDFVAFLASLGRNAAIPDSLDILEQWHYLVSLVREDTELLFNHEAYISHVVAMVYSYEFSLEARQELLSADTVICALMAQTGQVSYALQQLSELLLKITEDKNAKKHCNLSTKDILLLTLRFYSLIGENSDIDSVEELRLQKAFVKAMISSNPRANSKAVALWVSKAFAKMHFLAEQRSALPTEFKRLINFEFVNPGPALSLFLRICQLANSSAIDIEFPLVSNQQGPGISNVLTGFSRLMRPNRTHPSQFSRIMFVAAGGITFAEIAQLKKWQLSCGKDLVVVSNAVVNRENIMASIFKSK